MASVVSDPMSRALHLDPRVAEINPENDVQWHIL